MPNKCIELHDSTLLTVKTKFNEITLCFFPAYIHESEGKPGIDNGYGWIQDIEIIIENPSFEKSVLGSLPATISEGVVRIDSTTYDNLVPVNILNGGKQEFEIDVIFDNNTRFRLIGANPRLIFKGSPRKIEVFKNS